MWCFVAHDMLFCLWFPDLWPIINRLVSSNFSNIFKFASVKLFGKQTYSFVSSYYNLKQNHRSILLRKANRTVIIYESINIQIVFRSTRLHINKTTAKCIHAQYKSIDSNYF
jgi:hypothetical protein